jgi:4-hydroxybenzoate polyprenyltransferase
MESNFLNQKADLSAHLRIMRVDHWVKNVFMIPGAALAIAFEAPKLDVALALSILLSVGSGFIALCLVSSANYVINEYLDRDFDRIHPMKNHRAANHFVFSRRLVIIHYFLLLTMACAASVKLETMSRAFLVALVIMGILYNVRPMRFKDRHYLDVVSESINNPIRLAIGWYCVVPNAVVPASAFLSFWGLGIFLMSLKRYVEMMLINDIDLLHTYRKSFAKWTSEKLLVLAFLGGLSSTFFCGVLLGRRNIDYMLLLPTLLMIYAEYFAISLALDEASYAPEKLMKRKRLKVLSLINLVLFILISFSNSKILTEWIPIAHA